jgi:hypothetical protein
MVNRLLVSSFAFKDSDDTDLDTCYDNQSNPLKKFVECPDTLPDVPSMAKYGKSIQPRFWFDWLEDLPDHSDVR